MALRLALKENLDDTLRRWEAFWAGELLDRPLVCIHGAKRRGVPGPSYHDRCHLPVDELVRKAVASVENVECWGEAMPYVKPELGPDQVGAWFGGELEFSAASMPTNWIHPFVADWNAARPLRVRRGHWVWQRTIEVLRALRGASEGRFLVGQLDWHSNYDALSAMRGPQALAMDFYDDPELVAAVGDEIGDQFAPLFREIEEAGGHPGRGYIGWIDAYSPTRFAVTQCDFACMLSKEMFDRYVLPQLRKEWAFLDRTIYHFDGVTALQHLPTLLAEPDVDCIQWVPGAGHREQWQWDELLLQIQRAGKAVEISAPPEQVKRLHGILRPEKVCYRTSCGSRAEADALLDWMRQHT